MYSSQNGSLRFSDTPTLAPTGLSVRRIYVYHVHPSVFCNLFEFNASFAFVHSVTLRLIAMLRYALMVAAALSLFTSAKTCSCFFPAPTLFDCAVDNDEAALLVTMKCVKSVICDANNGAAVVDVVIDKVFKDQTGMGLSVGDMVTVRSLTGQSLCGTGLSFEAQTQWIMFVHSISQPGTNIDDIFSDATICEVGDADLSTNVCSGNIREPTQNQINNLMDGCRGFVTAPAVQAR